MKITIDGITLDVEVIEASEHYDKDIGAITLEYDGRDITGLLSDKVKEIIRKEVFDV